MVENDVDRTNGSLTRLRLARDGQLEGELKELYGLCGKSTEGGGDVTEDDRKSLESGDRDGVRGRL